MTAAEETELGVWRIWTPSGSVTPSEYLASKPPVDQVRARLDLLLGQPERYQLLARAFADYLGLDFDVLFTGRHPLRASALAAQYRTLGEHRSTPPPVQGSPQAILASGTPAVGHGEPPAKPTGEHPAALPGEHSEEPIRGERRRRTLSPETAAMLRAARGRCSWSVRQAAAQVGVAGGTIGMLESATRAPSRQVAERLVDVYRLSGDEAAQLLREASAR